MPQAAFDINGARQAGASDDDILEYLNPDKKFDVQGAKAAGASTQDILDYLAVQPPAAPAAPAAPAPVPPPGPSVPASAPMVQAPGLIGPPRSASTPLTDAEKQYAPPVPKPGLPDDLWHDRPTTPVVPEPEGLVGPPRPLDRGVSQAEQQYAPSIPKPGLPASAEMPSVDQAKPWWNAPSGHGKLFDAMWSGDYASIVPAVKDIVRKPLGPDATDEDVEKEASGQALHQANQISRGVARTMAGLASPESLDQMATIATGGEVLPALAKAKAIAQALKGAPQVLRALDVMASGAVPAAIGIHGLTQLASQPRPENLEQATETALNALMAGAGVAGAISAGRSALTKYRANPEASVNPRAWEKEATAHAAGLEAQGENPAATFWRDQVRQSRIARKAAGAPDAPIAIGTTEGTVFLQPAQNQRVGGKTIRYESILDADGNLVVGGTPQTIREWLDFRDAEVLTGKAVPGSAGPPITGATGRIVAGTTNLKTAADMVGRTDAPPVPEAAQTAGPLTGDIDPLRAAATQSLGFDPLGEVKIVPDVKAFKKALDGWNKQLTDATQKLVESHPGMTWEDAEQIAIGDSHIPEKPVQENFKTTEKIKPAKPVKPNKVDAVSSETPNPPTAALPTTPEKPETMAVQVEQAKQGIRRVVMFPKGTDVDYDALDGLGVTSDGFGNIYAYRKDLISNTDIKAAAKNNTLGQILGHAALGMGAPDKADIQGDGIPVVTRAPDGTEVQSTVTDPAHLPQTMDASHALVPDGGTVSVEPAEDVLAGRGPEVPDDVYAQAVAIVREVGKASTSTLQRRLRLGYGAASRVLDRMYAEGLIGPPNGAAPREVLAQPDAMAAPAPLGGTPPAARKLDKEAIKAEAKRRMREQMGLAPEPVAAETAPNGPYGDSGAFPVLMNRAYAAHEKLKAGEPLNAVDKEAIWAFTGNKVGSNPAATRADLENAIKFSFDQEASAIGVDGATALHRLYRGGTELSGAQMDALEAVAGGELKAKDEQPLPDVNRPEMTHPLTYFTGSSGPSVEAIANKRGDIGLMITPLKSDYISKADKYPFIAIDNGAFSTVQAFSGEKFLKLLDAVAAKPEVARKVQFVVAPDVVYHRDGKIIGDAAATLAQFPEWAAQIHQRGLPVALAAQNGLEDMLDQIPWDDFETLFIAGDDAWKLGNLETEEARKKWKHLIATAVNDHGKKIHVGRVNSFERADYSAFHIGAISVDGTHLKHGPDEGLARIESWLNRINMRNSDMGPKFKNPRPDQAEENDFSGDPLQFTPQGDSIWTSRDDRWMITEDRGNFTLIDHDSPDAENSDYRTLKGAVNAARKAEAAQAEKQADEEEPEAKPESGVAFPARVQQLMDTGMSQDAAIDAALAEISGRILPPDAMAKPEDLGGTPEEPKAPEGRRVSKYAQEQQAKFLEAANTTPIPQENWGRVVTYVTTPGRKGQTFSEFQIRSIAKLPVAVGWAADKVNRDLADAIFGRLIAEKLIDFDQKRTTGYAIVAEPSPEAQAASDAENRAGLPGRIVAQRTQIEATKQWIENESMLPEKKRDSKAAKKRLAKQTRLLNQQKRDLGRMKTALRRLNPNAPELVNPKKPEGPKAGDVFTIGQNTHTIQKVEKGEDGFPRISTVDGSGREYTFTGRDAKQFESIAKKAPDAMAAPEELGGKAAPAAKPDKDIPPPEVSTNWMNRWDVEEALERYRKHPVLSKATKFLSDFVEETDSHSDGWPYWKLPGHAARRLMTLISHPEAATEKNLRWALAPIRAFYTKHGEKAGMKFPEIALAAKADTVAAPEAKAVKTKPATDAQRRAVLKWMQPLDDRNQWAALSPEKVHAKYPANVINDLTAAGLIGLFQGTHYGVTAMGKAWLVQGDFAATVNLPKTGKLHTPQANPKGLKMGDSELESGLRSLLGNEAMDKALEENEAPEPSGSFKYQLQIHGEGDKWHDNAVAFATREEAEQAGLSKFTNWTMADAYRVVPSTDPVNYKIEDGKMVSVKAEAPQAPEAKPAEPRNALSDIADARKAAMRERLRQKKGLISRPREEAESQIDPEDMTDLAQIGAERILAGAVKFSDWERQVMADVGDLVETVAQGAGLTNAEMLRLVHEYAREVAEDFGVTAEATPEAPDEEGVKSNDGAGTDRSVRDPDHTPLGDELPEGSGGAEGAGPTFTGSAGGRRSRGGGNGGVRDQAEDELEPGVRTGDRGVGETPERGLDAVDTHHPPKTGNSVNHSRDYRIPDGRVISGDPQRRAQINIDVLRLLRTLETENRTPTIDEQHVLAGYVGWGGAKQLFTERPEWAAAQADVRDLMTPEEFAAARQSTQNAHYTGDFMVDAIWKALRHLGAQPGMSWLEPSVGSGNFLGRQPEDLLRGARRIGIDKDATTAKIAQYLYPDSGIDNTPLEKADLPNDYFDFSASNVPFGKIPIFDPAFRSKPYLTKNIHNYFFAKALNSVRPGGIIAFITSRYTMDSFGVSSTAARRYLAGKADLIGAIRLPRGAHKQAANTDVITDIIFLRRRIDGAPKEGPDWIESKQKSLRTASGLTYQHGVNEYFHDHPEMILGTEGLSRGEFSDHDYSVAGTVTPEMLDAAIDRLPGDQFREWVANSPIRRNTLLRDLSGVPEAKTGAFFFDSNGNLFRKVSRGEAAPEDASDLTKARIRGQLGLRDIFIALTTAERAGIVGDEIEGMRKALNAAYDKFVNKHGLLSSRENQRAMMGDPDAPWMPGLERDYDQGDSKSGRKPSAKKAPIFAKRLFGKIDEVAPQNAKEALSVVLNSRGYLDWEYLKEVTGLDDAMLASELTGIVFNDPVTKQWETADEYLSGSVRTKLRAARALARTDNSIEPNVKALEAVQPEDVPPSRIRAMLGVTWVPLETYAQFLKETLGLSEAPTVTHIGNEWTTGVEWHPSTRWDTARVSAGRLIDAALNLRRVKVYDRADGRTFINTEQTLAAAQRQTELNDHFQKWLFADTARGDSLVRTYNDLQNDLRLRKFDGSHLTLPGMSRAALRGGNLEPYQSAAVWRMIVQKSVLLNHAPGAGKTFEMIAAGMELKRLGLIQRPVYVVPNSTLGGWQDQFATLYPEARVLVFSESDLKKNKRRATVARMATGDWDAVVIPHSSFQLIPVGDAIFNDYYAKLEAELTEQIMDAQGAGLDTRMVTRMERKRDTLLTNLQNRRNNARQDNLVNWEQLGVDQLFVDESHEFKKLGFATKQAGVAGIDYNGNQKTFDLRMKVAHTQNHGRGVVFASGTPVTNTMGEIYSIMRYLIEPEMEARGIAKFDDWAADYGRIRDSFEPKPEGGGYRNVARFAKFVNLPRLATLLRTFSDVMTSDMLDIPRPAFAGGQRKAVVTEMSDEQHAFQHDLQGRASAIRSNPRAALPDGMLVVFGDGGKMSMDIRMVEQHGSDDPKGRLSQAAENIHYLWKQSEATKGTQLVFSDIGVPQDGRRARATGGPGKKTDFSVYDEMIRKLVKLGIPREEIAHMGEAKNKQARKQLFRKVNEGTIRVLIGSSQKMGIGVNVQDRGYALHHLDIPARPDILEQREARFIRQGNIHPEVHILYYTTKGTLDENKFGNVVRKGKFINDLWKGDFTLEEAEDLTDGVPSWEMFQALTSGDPRILRKLEVDSELDRLSRLQSAFQDQMYGIRGRIAWARSEVPRLTALGKELTAAHGVAENAGRVWMIAGERFSGEGISEKAGTALIAAAMSGTPEGVKIGTAHGMDIIAGYTVWGDDKQRNYKVTLQHGTLNIGSESLHAWTMTPAQLAENKSFNEKAKGGAVFKTERPEDNLKPASLITRLENDIRGMGPRIEMTAATLQRNLDEIEHSSKDADQQWPYEDDMAKLLTEQRELEVALGVGQDDHTAIAMDNGEVIVDDSVEAEQPEGEDDEAEQDEDGDKGVIARPRADLIDDKATFADQFAANRGQKADAKYEALEPGQPGHIYVNESGAKLIASVFHTQPAFLGLTASPGPVLRLINGLEAMGTPEAGRILDAINQAVADDPVITIVDASHPDYRNTRREEKFHRAQIMAGLAGESGSTSTRLMAIPEIAAAARQLQKRQRYSDEKALIELGALLGANRGAELGLSPEAATKLFRSYMNALIAEHGPEAGTILKGAVPQVRRALGDEYVKARWNGNYKAEPGRVQGEVREDRGLVARPRNPLHPQGQGQNAAGVPAPAKNANAGTQSFTQEIIEPKVASALSTGLGIVKAAVDFVNPRYFAPTSINDAVSNMVGGRVNAEYLIAARLNKWSERFRKMSRTDMVAFVDRVKAGDPQPDQELTDAAAFMRRADDALWNAIPKRMRPRYLEDHYRVMWKVIPGSAGVKQRFGFRGPARRSLEGTKGALKRHTLDSMAEGIEMGGVPYSYNPLVNFAASYNDTMKFVTAQRLWRQFGKMGARKFVRRLGGTPPEGFAKLNAEIARAYFPVPQGMVEVGDWYVQKNAAHLLNNMLGRDILRESYEDNPLSQFSGPLGRVLLRIKNYTTAIELSISPYHAVFEGIEAVGSMMGLGVREMVNLGFAPLLARAFGLHTGVNSPDPVAAVGRGLATIGKATAAFYTMAHHGRMAKMAFTDYPSMLKTAAGRKWLADNPSAVSIIPYYFAGGGTLTMPEDFQIRGRDGFIEYLNEARDPAASRNQRIAAGIGAGAKTVAAANEMIMKPLFEKYIPYLKLGFFVREFAQARNEYASRLASGEMSQGELARRVVTSIENRFGEMNFDKLFWNRTFKSALQLLFRSVTWKLGNLGEGWNAFSKQFQEIARSVKGTVPPPPPPARGGKGKGKGKLPPPPADEAPGKIHEIPLLDMSLGWLIGTAMAAAFVSEILSQVVPGAHRPKTFKDMLYPDIGDGVRASLPSYIRDYSHLAHDPVGYFTSAESGMIGRTIELMENREFGNQQIWDEDDPLYQRFWKIAKHEAPTPFTITSGYKAIKRGDYKEGIANLLAFSKAPGYVDKSDAEQLVQKYAGEHSRKGTMTAIEAKRQDFASRIRKELRRGHNPAAVIRAGKQAGLISDQDVRTYQREAMKPALEGQISALPLREMLDVYNAATPEERQSIKGIVERKARREALLHPGVFGNKDSKARKLASKYFGIDPPLPVDQLASPGALQ